MSRFDLKRGLGCAVVKGKAKGRGRGKGNKKKKPITEKMIKMQAIEAINKHKALNYNMEDDNSDLYTSYFAGPGQYNNRKKELKLEYEKKFKFSSSILPQK